jgi:hypothetical protein
LVQDPEAELRRICAFLELNFDRRMLSFGERVRQHPETVAPHLVNLTLDAALAAEPERPRQGLVTPQEMQTQLAARLSGPPDASSVGRWRSQMAPAEVLGFAEVAGDLLEELGYPRT